MIKPQQVPSLFEDFKKIITNDFLRNVHINAAEAGTLSLLNITHDHESLEKRKRTASKFSVDDYKTFKSGIQNGEVPLFFCDEDMSGMIEMATQSLTIEDSANPDLIHSDKGFCYFADGIPIGDSIIHAITWTPDITDGKDGYLITSYNDRFNQQDKLGTYFWDYLHEESSIPIPDSRWVYRFTTDYHAGQPMVPPQEIVDAAKRLGADEPVPILPGAILHCLMLMLQQPPEIIRVEKKKLENKKQIKRLADKKIPSEVTVIDIRHRYESVYSSATPSPVNWSRRWLVSGHWRWQPYKDGVKRIWVMPYVKGPSDKPFIATKRVIALLK